MFHNDWHRSNRAHFPKDPDPKVILDGKEQHGYHGILLGGTFIDACRMVTAEEETIGDFIPGDEDA